MNNAKAHNRNKRRVDAERKCDAVRQAMDRYKVDTPLSRCRIRFIDRRHRELDPGNNDFKPFVDALVNLGILSGDRKKNLEGAPVVDQVKIGKDEEESITIIIEEIE